MSLPATKQYWLFTPLSSLVLDSTNQPARELIFQLFIINEGKLLLLQPHNETDYTVPTRFLTQNSLRASSYYLTLHTLRHAIEERTLQNLHFPGIVADTPIIEHSGPETRFSIILIVGSSSLTPTSNFYYPSFPFKCKDIKWIAIQDFQSLPVNPELQKPRPGGDPRNPDYTLKTVANHCQALIQLNHHIRIARYIVPKDGKWIMGICLRAIRVQTSLKAIEQGEDVKFLIITIRRHARDTIWLLDAGKELFEKREAAGHDLVLNPKVKIGDRTGEREIVEYRVAGQRQHGQDILMSMWPSQKFFEGDGLVNVKWIQRTKETTTAKSDEAVAKNGEAVAKSGVEAARKGEQATRRDSVMEDVLHHPMRTDTEARQR